MTTTRLEAFSDGVLAIIITIMVLELKIPEGHDFSSLKPLFPTIITYVLSFIYIGIYWNNHHHLLHLTKEVNGKILWANLHLLFWLSLLPFATGYMGENHFEKIPTAIYGFILLMASLAWTILLLTIKYSDKKKSNPFTFLNFKKIIISNIFYAIATLISFFFPLVAGIIYIGIAVLWFIPNKKIEESI
ncbi:TMEM175 family protein [Cellulophaga baltica]|uniref:Uncharacterized membrane protein n=1 Tax=Cellulophaga baltica TaxID=76594 RepID=A0A1G7K098_9FLAO|nr:TMEM175 family protein [Cellulophaga baltica]SDF30653.1 Uncharacterized membrane protein [Cellulophaga baltica]